MKNFTKLVTLSLSLIVAAAAHADFVQEYNQPLSSFVSTVRSCPLPVPAPLAAADDFRFGDNFVINHFRWWGSVSNIAQLGRVYYIALYRDAGCRPGKLIYQTCGIPMTGYWALDCRGNAVYVFNIDLANPLPIPGGHYWFRVAESDFDSVRPGKVDFQWSGHRPIQGCRAGQQSFMGWGSPLLDACDNMPDDLAFCVLG